MNPNRYDAEAVREAAWVFENCEMDSRGVIPSREVPGLFVAYGNYGYGHDERTRNEVRRMRAHCEAAGMTVVGFGVDPLEGYTWAILIETRFASLLDDLLWQACADAWGREALAFR